ncbi:MAG: ComEA family DNA-binding protein [Granulosicoccus sp.]
MKLLLTLVIAITVLLHDPSAFAGDRIDVNTADAAELAEKLRGIGPAKARAIVEFRSAHGPFRSVDDLLDVKGIGNKTLDKLREAIDLGDETLASGSSAAPDPEVKTRFLIRNIVRDANSAIQTDELNQ